MRICLAANAYATDLLDRSLRAQVVCANHEDDIVDKLESVRQHEPLHLAVVNAAPVRSRQESPSDLYLASLEIVAMKSR